LVFESEHRMKTMLLMKTRSLADFPLIEAALADQ